MHQLYDVYTSPRVNTVSPEQVLGPLTPQLKLSEVEFGLAPLYIDNVARGLSVEYTYITESRSMARFDDGLLDFPSSAHCRILIQLSLPSINQTQASSLVKFITNHFSIQRNTSKHNLSLCEICNVVSHGIGIFTRSCRK